MREDSDGMLWVFLTVPRKPGERVRRPEAMSGEREGPAISYLELMKHYRSVIDVIDPKRRELVISATLDSFYFVGRTPELLFSPRLTADGHEVIDLWTAAIVRH